MSFFNNIPDKPYDFVYEDRCDHVKTKIAGDILRLEKKAIENGIADLKKSLEGTDAEDIKKKT